MCAKNDFFKDSKILSFALVLRFGLCDLLLIIGTRLLRSDLIGRKSKGKFKREMMFYDLIG